MLVTIYHNPRCSKSRKALEILENKKIDVKIIPYLDHGISTEEVLNLAKVLGLNVIDFIRKKEDEFKALNMVTESDQDCADAIHRFPKILERPIVIVGERGVIARPPEKLEELL